MADSSSKEVAEITCIFVNLSLRANFEYELQFVFAFVAVFVFGRARQS